MRFSAWIGACLFASWAFVSASGVLGQEKGKDADKTAKKSPAIRIQVECDPKEAIYKLDQPAKFFFASSAAGEVVYRMSEDGLKTIKEGKLAVAARQTYILEGKLDKPGILRLDLQQGSARAAAAAAFEPTRIEPTAKAPADFDTFWQGQLKELAKVRVDPEVDLILAKSTAITNAYRLKLASIEGRTVHGWITVPKTEGPFPVILTVPSAGVYPIEPDHYHAGLGALAINIIIHDIAVDFPRSYFEEKSNGDLKDYTRKGWDDKQKCYFRHAFLAGVRALDYATGRKDFNGKEVGVTGSSQGGALTLALSGLDPRVTLAAPNVAGLCDLNGREHGRIDGWPHWLANVPAALKPKVVETSQYYDAVNFARKFKGKSLHGVGFLDTVCPPTTVYAAYNVHPEPKRMIASPLMGHAVDPAWTKAREEFWKANLTLKVPVEKK